MGAIRPAATTANVSELSDAAAALDWLQGMNPDAKSCWIAGYSFGAWIGMQLLMRRPEIDCFISVAPPANSYDFAFLAPCPSSGLIVGAERDEVVPQADIQKLVDHVGEALKTLGVTNTGSALGPSTDPIPGQLTRVDLASQLY